MEKFAVQYIKIQELSSTGEELEPNYGYKISDDSGDIGEATEIFVLGFSSSQDLIDTLNVHTLLDHMLMKHPYLTDSISVCNGIYFNGEFIPMLVDIDTSSVYSRFIHHKPHNVTQCGGRIVIKKPEVDADK